MNSLVWYKSPVYVSAVVSLITGALVLINKQDVVPVEIVTKSVEDVFSLIAAGAAAYAAWKRQKSDVQPLTLKQPKE